MTALAELAESRELFVNLTLRELRGKYKRSLLGWTWSLLNPLATMVIFTVVFRFFLKVEPPRGDPSGLHAFALFLLCGLLPWNFLSNGMSGSMGALIGNSNLIKKVFFPREVLVASNIASWVVSFLLEMAVLAVVLLIAGQFVLPWLVPALGLVMIQTMFVVGLGLLLSVLNVYFRDVQHFIGILLQIWFYATPIVYPMTVVRNALDQRPELFTLYKLNPMVRFVEAYRDCLYDLRFPALLDTVYLLGVSAATLALGVFVFSRLEPKLAEEL
ncbi:MAG: ABC transporter permease [Actinomycetota bacterium]|nr:ABC transporter permease [Actinomycetota bacterium]